MIGSKPSMVQAGVVGDSRKSNMASKKILGDSFLIEMSLKGLFAIQDEETDSMSFCF